MGQSGSGGGGGASGTDLAPSGGDGGAGGNAGAAGAQSAGGGGGGGGGNGIDPLTTPFTNPILDTVSGGNGGAGGAATAGADALAAGGGGGGAGGAGIVGTGATITNNGTIEGGAGGVGGAGANGGANGADGDGGVGITGSGLTITNSGTISGGLSGDGVTQAAAIQFTSGVNVLTITSTSVINGDVLGADGDDTLGLGGAVSPVAAFDLTDIGPGAQYGIFGTLSKSGTSVWTLSGTPGSSLNYVVSAGELNLGGTTQSTPSFIITGGTLSNGTLTVNGGASAINAQAGTVSAVLAVLAGTGGLTKSTVGTVILSGANTYAGGTLINNGTLAVTGAGTLGATAGSTTVGNAATPGNTTVLNLGGTAAIQQAGLTQNAGSTVTSTVGGLGVTPTPATISVANYTLNGGTLAAPVTVSAATSHAVRAGTVNGVLAGAAGVTKTTAGTVTFTGANTYTGGTTVDAGTLALSGAGTLGATTGATTVNGGALDLGGTTQTQASLTQTGGAVSNGTLLVGSAAQGGGTNSATLGAAGTRLTTFSQTGGTYSGNAFTQTYTLNGATAVMSGNVNASIAFALQQGLASGVLSGTGAATKTTAGTVTLSGVNTYTGGTTVSVGTLTIAAGGSVAGAVTNAQGAVTNVDGSVGGAFTNNGTLNLISGVIGGALTNNATGETRVSGANTVGSIANSGGLVTLQNGVFGDSLSTSVGGGYSATGNARIALDFDNANPNGPQQDSVDFNGTASGVTTVNIQEVGARRLFAPQTVISTNALAPGAAFNGVFSGTDGIIAYDLVQQGNDFAVVSSLDASAAGAAAGAVTSSIVAVGTGFIDAASAFISAPANPEADQVTFGFWGRTKGGKYDIDTDTSVDISGATGSSDTTTYRTSFWGYQFGADVGRLNVGGSGFNLHGGVTAGDVDIDTDAKGGASSADTKAPFVGIYGAVTGHGFFADLQIQRNFYKTKLDVPLGGLDDEKVKGRGYSIVFSGGKVIPLNDTWFIEPSVGLNYVRVDTDRVAFANVGSVQVKDVESLLGRLGLRVGTAFQATETLILRPAVAASVWHEFENNANSTFSFDPGVAGVGVSDADIKTSRIGTFGQIGVSLSGQMTDSPLLGFVRADYRKGKNIDGYALTGGLRTQF